MGEEEKIANDNASQAYIHFGQLNDNHARTGISIVALDKADVHPSDIAQVGQLALE